MMAHSSEKKDFIFIDRFIINNLSTVLIQFTVSGWIKKKTNKINNQSINPSIN